MTRLSVDQLPSHVRRRIEAEAGATRPAKSRKGIGLTAPCPGRCGCGQRFPTAAAWERHAQAEGHTVWAIDLPADPDPDAGR